MSSLSNSHTMVVKGIVTNYPLTSNDNGITATNTLSSLGSSGFFLGRAVITGVSGSIVTIESFDGSVDYGIFIFTADQTMFSATFEAKIKTGGLRVVQTGAATTTVLTWYR